MAKRLAVYTAIIGNYDSFVPPLPGDYDLYLFSDTPHAAGWGKVKLVERKFEDPTRDARRIKILSHELLPEYEYTLWVDGTMRWKELNPEKLIEDWLGDKDLATVKHHERDCIYEEAAILMHFVRDNPELIKEQIIRYRALGFPPGNGLAETRMVLRRNGKEVSYFNDCWWNELKHGSRRDQVSFPVAAWMSGLKYRLIDALYKDLGFAVDQHLK